MAAMALAAYLLWVSFRGMGMIGCGSGSGCEELLRSRWAYWLGLPVSLGGLLLYTALFASTFWLHGDGKNAAWRVVVLGGMVVMGAAIWFGLVQLVVVKRFCPFCSAAHACAFLASASLLANAPLGFRVKRGSGSPKASAVIGLGKPGLVGAAILAALIGGQFAYRPPTQRVQPVAGVERVIGGDSREVAIFDGRFRINLKEVPMMGSPESPHVLVALLDYTCYACRILHSQLVAAQSVFSNQLAVVTLPMPLDGTCNPTVTQVFPAHSNACEYARMGLVLWRTNRAAFAQFEGWVFSSPEAPAVGEARQVAERLLGAERFKMTLKDPWIDEQIRRDVAIYEATFSRTKTHSMPQLIVGTNLIFGNFASMDDLFGLLRDQIGLSKSP